jgi:hypothetical protein
LRDGRVIWLQRPVRQARCLGDALVISLADVRRLRISLAQAIPGGQYPWQKSPSSGSDAAEGRIKKDAVLGALDSAWAS